MSNDQAKFTISGTPSADPATGDRRYQATAGEVLTLTLEASPSSVLRATYSVYDPTVPDSPLASMDAPLLTFVGSGTSSDSPAAPNGSVTIAMPGAAAHSYNIRCIVATAAGQQEFVRQAAVPFTLGIYDIAKTTPEETTEYFARTWSDKFNQYLNYIAAFTLVGLDDAYDKGGAALGYFITADIHPVTITVPDTSNNAGISLIQNDVTNNPNALEISNAGTGFSLSLQGTTRIINSDNANLNISTTTAGALITDSVGNTEINSSGGQILIGHDADAQNINIGTGAAARPLVWIGNAAVIEVQIDAKLVDINAGTTGMTLDSAAGISLDAVTTSNFTMSAGGDGARLTIETLGAGNQGIAISSAGNVATAIAMTATAGGIEVDAVLDVAINSSTGSILIGDDAVAKPVNIGTAGARTISVGSAVATAVNIDAIAVSIDATATSNVTVTGSAQSLAFAVVGAGAQKLTIDSAGTGADSIDITSSVGGIELNSALGVAVIGGILQMTAGGTISTTGNADLNLIPHGTGLTKIGDAAAITLPVPTNDDLGVTGRIQVLGTAEVGLSITGLTDLFLTTPNARITSHDPANYGCYMVRNTFQTKAAVCINTGVVGNYILVCEYADRAFDFQQVQRTNPTFIIQSANQSLTEWRSLAHNQVDALDEIGSGSMVYEHKAPTELADDASFDLPANSAGWCHVLVGDAEEYAHFVWDSTEVVDLIYNSANVVTTDTDTKFCVFDGGGKVTVRNRLGGARKVTFDLHFFTP